MNEITVSSTSAWRADAGDIELLLSESKISRLVFRSEIVNNSKKPEANVRGKFVWQRKSINESWIDVESQPLNRLRKGEGYEITLDSEAVFRLLNGLASRSDIQKQDGLPWGQARYVPVESAVTSLIDLEENELSSYLNANKSIGSELVGRLLDWSATAEDVADLIKTLERLGPDAFSTLATAVSLKRLEESLEYWNANRNNSSEEFWHTALTQRNFLFQQLYSWPCTVINDKAFVGGKNIYNTGGGIADFIVSNELTNSLAIIEIKSPRSDLVTGGAIREGVHNVSSELSGAIVQVLSYRHRLATSINQRESNPDDLEAFDPHCVVIIGNYENLDTSHKLRSFELYRRQFTDVEVITYDELFRRVERTIQLLRRPPLGTTDDDELPW